MKLIFASMFHKILSLVILCCLATPIIHSDDQSSSTNEANLWLRNVPNASDLKSFTTEFPTIPECSPQDGVEACYTKQIQKCYEMGIFANSGPCYNYGTSLATFMGDSFLQKIKQTHGINLAEEQKQWVKKTNKTCQDQISDKDKEENPPAVIHLMLDACNANATLERAKELEFYFLKLSSSKQENSANTYPSPTPSIP